VNPEPKLSGLQRIAFIYGRIKCGDTMMAWDYANNVALPEKELIADKERHAASERAKWENSRSVRINP